MNKYKKSYRKYFFIYTLILAVLTVTAHILGKRVLLFSGDFELLKIIGVFLTALGILFFVATIFHANENTENDGIETTGIYSFVRNPLYSSALLFFSGLTLYSENPVFLIFLPLYWLIMTIIIKNTADKWFEELCGEEFVQYKRAVNRCLPWFRGAR